MEAVAAGIASVSVRSSGNVVAPSRSAVACSAGEGRPANSRVCVGARAVAMAAPIPRLAPVISAVRMPASLRAASVYAGQAQCYAWSPAAWAGAGLPTGSLAASRSSGASALVSVSKSGSLSWLSSAARAVIRLVIDSR